MCISDVLLQTSDKINENTKRIAKKALNKAVRKLSKNI
jgi:hypothetical protein